MLSKSWILKYFAYSAQNNCLLFRDSTSRCIVFLLMKGYRSSIFTYVIIWPVNQAPINPLIIFKNNYRGAFLLCQKFYPCNCNHQIMKTSLTVSGVCLFRSCLLIDGRATASLALNFGTDAVTMYLCFGSSN